MQNLQLPNPNPKYLSTIEDFIALLGQKGPKAKILTHILPYALSISQAEIGAFLVVEDITAIETNDMTLVAHQGMTEEIIKLLDGGELSQQLQTGRPLWVGVKSLRLDIVQTLLRKYKLKGLFGLPLGFNGHFLGAIVTATRNKQSALFDPTVRQHLSTLTYLVSLFLDHTRLQTYRQSANHQQANHALNLLQEANQPPAANNADELELLLATVMAAEEEVVSQNNDLGILNTLSNKVGNTLQLNRILGDGVEETMNALRADAGWCYLLEADILSMAEQRGLSEKYVEGLGQLTPGNGTDGIAFTRNEAILRDSLLFHSGKARRLVKKEGLRAVAAVPLITQGKPFGVLAVGKRQEQNWSVRDERMIVSISQRLAQAVSNAQTFALVENQVHDLENRNIQLQRANTQQAEDFEMLKQQIREILRLQERALHAQTSVANIHTKYHSENPLHSESANVQLIASLKRALAVISAA